MSYSSARSLGADPPSAYPPSVVSVPAETSHPYVTMPVCDVQRHLIAGRNPSLVPDGVWGGASQVALMGFAKRRPLAEAQSVHPDGLPLFGMRSDYKFDGQKIRIPAVYAAALPPMANVACPGPRATSTPTPSTPAPEVPATSWMDSGSSVSGGIGSYWPWFAALAAAAGGYYWWKKTHP